MWNVFNVTSKTPERRLYSKLTIKTPGQRHWRHSGVFIINFEHKSHHLLMLLLLFFNKYMLAGLVLSELFSYLIVKVIHSLMTVTIDSSHVGCGRVILLLKMTVSTLAYIFLFKVNIKVRHQSYVNGIVLLLFFC